MKKQLILPLLLLLIASTSEAQLLQFGVKAGLNYANFSGTSVQTDAITSYHLGLISEIKILDKFAIQPELLYSTQGASYENAGKEITNELGYIALPVMAKFYLGKSFDLEIGPQASFLLSEKSNFDLSDPNTFDFAINLGMGFKLTKSIFVQGRYVIGLTEISPNADAKNSVLQLSAGFLF